MKTEYKDYLHEAYRGEVRKLSYYAPTKNADFCVTPFVSRRVRKLRVPNAKRRVVVQKRIAKLLKYVKRAWNGYSFGKVKANG
jgi:hypothetical protein